MNEWLVPADCSTQTLEDWLQCSQFPVVPNCHRSSGDFYGADFFTVWLWRIQQTDPATRLRKSIQRQSFVSNLYSCCLLLLYLIYCLFLLPLVSPTRCCTNSSKTALSKIIETMLHRRPIMRDLKSYLHLQSICIVCNALSMKCWWFNYRTGSFYPLQHNILVTILVDPMEVLLNGIWSCFTGGTLQLGCIGCTGLK